MAEETQTSRGSFTSAMTLSQMGVSSVPQCYILPLPQRPAFDQTLHCSVSALPVIDLSSLGNPFLRPQVIKEVHVACKELGVFQVINHGIPISSANEALDVAADFFDMPNETKMRLASPDVCKPAQELVDEQHPLAYKEGSFKDFLHFLSDNDIKYELQFPRKTSSLHAFGHTLQKCS